VVRSDAIFWREAAAAEGLRGPLLARLRRRPMSALQLLSGGDPDISQRSPVDRVWTHKRHSSLAFAERDL